MRPSQISSVIQSLIASTGRIRPVFVWGPPGVGKSDIIAQAAEAAQRTVIDVRAVLLDPVDLRGLPRVNGDGRVHWCPPDFLPHDPASRAVLFLDELAQAPPLVQSACLQLTLNRKLGEYQLPKDVVIIAASNRQEDRAGAHRLITPLLNRFIHLDIEVSNDDWQAWALTSGIDARVRAFLNFRPSTLFIFEPKTNARAFPTPRSWEMVSDCIQGVPYSAIHELAKGCVGEGAAAEFTGFCNVYGQLPDIKQVLANPSGVSVPQEPSVLYATCGALVEAVRADHKLAGNFAIYASRMPTEFSALAMRDCSRIVPTVLNTPAGTTWLRANRDVLVAQ